MKPSKIIMLPTPTLIKVTKMFTFLKRGKFD